MTIAAALGSARTAKNMIGVIDSHTCGQPTRVICDGLPAIRYDTIAEARDVLRSQHDWVRRCAVFEPHGHASLFCAALVPPVDPGCASGVVFMDAAGYHDMCGHATIGVVTTLVDLGRITTGPDGETAVPLETPLGRIETRAEIRDRRAVAVTFVNQPAFVLETVSVEYRGVRLAVPIAFGGQWYAFVDARKLGLTVEANSIAELVRSAAELRPLIAGAVTCPDPRTSTTPRVENVMWLDDAGAPTHGRNMPVNVAGGFDRSPCGTGTSARLAVMAAAGVLEIGNEYLNSGVLGTTYRGRVLEATAVGGIPAIVPEITGAAWVTGRAALWVDPTDPLGSGFCL